MSSDIICIKDLFFNLKKIKSFDIIQGHQIKIMFVFLLFNVFLKKKSVYVVQGSYNYLSSFNKILAYYIFSRVDSVVFVNKELHTQLNNNLKKLIQDKYEIILNGINPDVKYEQINYKEKYEINQNHLLLLHPARFVLEKNHFNLLKALKIVSKNYNNIVLILAGDGTLKEDIIREIKQLELEKNVMLLGTIPRNDVFALMDICEIFVMPSISEGFNTAFMEALAFKRKIMVSNIEQFTYPIKNSGLDINKLNISFVDPNSVDKMASSLEQLISKERVIDCYEYPFSFEKMFLNYLELYKSIVK